MNTMIMLDSVELQQSWELSIAIRACPKVGTLNLWIILIAFVLGVSRLNKKKKFQTAASNFLFTKTGLSSTDFILSET